MNILPKIAALSLLLAFVVLPQTTFGAVTLLEGDKISIEADEIIESDYYVSVGILGTTVMSGIVEGDMYSFAGSVTANGTVEGDFGAIGGLAFMHASVTDDVRIVAGEAVIDEFVGGDVLVIGGILKVLSTATIGGDVVFYGGEGEIAGEVGGSIYGSSNKLRIDGKVGGDINVDVTRGLTLGSNADVAGAIQYRSLTQLERAQEAVVAGQIQKLEMQDMADDTDTLRAFFVPLFVSLFATLTLYLLFKKEMLVIIKVILERPLVSGVVGLATVTTGPFVSLLLISTVLGMLLGVFGIGLLLLLFAIGFSMAIVLMGALMAKAATAKPQISLLWILTGAFSFHVMLLIPVLGIMAAIALFVMAVGGVAVALYRKIL